MVTTPSNMNPGRDPMVEPLTASPVDHPVGTGVGAVAGGLAAGAAAGSVVGPVGTVIGAIAGAVLGGMAGNAVAEQIDPVAEDAYWRDNYSSRPYATPGSSYDDYGPAYRYGVDSYRTQPSSAFDETRLAQGWDKAKGTSRLGWDQAKNATRDSWHRVSDAVERAVPGDSDRDGK